MRQKFREYDKRRARICCCGMGALTLVTGSMIARQLVEGVIGVHKLTRRKRE